MSQTLVTTYYYDFFDDTEIDHKIIELIKNQDNSFKNHPRLILVPKTKKRKEYLWIDPICNLINNGDLDLNDFIFVLKQYLTSHISKLSRIEKEMVLDKLQKNIKEQKFQNIAEKIYG